MTLTDTVYLADFFESRFQPEQLAARSRDTRTAYRRAVSRFRVFMDREPTIDDLTLPNCERFETWLKENGFATKSGHDGYRCLLAIWRFAYQVEAVDRKPPLKRRRGPSESEAFLSAEQHAKKPAFVLDFVRQYAIERGLSPASARHLRHVLNSFAKSINRRPRLSDLRDDCVNRWVVGMQENGLAPETVRRHKISLVGLWRAAVDADLLATGPKRIRKVKVPQKLPSAWSQEELARLLDVAGKVPNTFQLGGIPRAAFWTAWILVAYHSGLRRADLLQLRFDQISADGWAAVVQNKTGLVVKRHLPPAVMAAVQATTPPKRRRLFGDVISPGRLRQEFSKIIKVARLKGSTKKLRATGATWCEAETPGSAMRFLGHRTPGLAYKSYVDPRHLQEKPTGPPAAGSISATDAKGGEA